MFPFCNSIYPSLVLHVSIFNCTSYRPSNSSSSPWALALHPCAAARAGCAHRASVSSARHEANQGTDEKRCFLGWVTVIYSDQWWLYMALSWFIVILSYMVGWLIDICVYISYIYKYINNDLWKFMVICSNCVCTFFLLVQHLYHYHIWTHIVFW